MSSSVPTFSSSQLASVADGMRAVGVDVAEVLRRAAVEPTVLSGRVRLPATLEARFWDEAVALTGDPALGLRVAHAVEPGGWGLFEYLVRSAATLHDAVELARTYGRLADDLFALELRLHDGVAWLELGRTSYPATVAATECNYALMVSEVGRLWPQAYPLSVQFAHAPTANLAVYRAHFSCPVRFEAELSAVSFPAAVLRMPRAAVDVRLTRVLEEQARRSLAELPATNTFLARSRYQLAVLMKQRTASTQALARRLAVSERTLRRKLVAEGTNYNALLDELRRTYALAQLQRAEVGLDVLAGRLGFRNMSTFHRAFKRWTGTTPGRYRRAATSEPAARQVS